MKRPVIGFVVSAFLVIGVPLAASAQSADMQSQISALLQQIKSLQQQLVDLIKQQQASSTPATALKPQLVRQRWCAIIRTLAEGAQGVDVIDLQSFLKERGYFNDDASGYFGPLTAAAVARWQKAEGVEAVGSFGPISRALLLRKWCAGGSTVFSATPQTGIAPLAVTFTAPGGSSCTDGPDYQIDYGDGAKETTPSCSPGTHSMTHTYAQAGAYTASLYSIPSGFGTGDRTPRLTDVQRIVVRNGPIDCNAIPTTNGPESLAWQKICRPKTCTQEYAPVCGQKQIVCVTTPCNPVQQTYSNLCSLTADGAAYLHSGQCTGASNLPPVISGFSGPTSLAVNQMGTWTIDASDPENGTLSYNVTWGDELSALAAANALKGTSFVQTTTFSHSYTAAGTYAVSVNVRDASGQSAQASTTVQVGNLLACRGYDAGNTTTFRDFAEGESTTCIPAGDAPGGRTCIADAHFTCRSGVWRVEGGLPVPTSCVDGGKAYNEGETISCLHNTDGTTSCIADAHFACRSGAWKREGGLPVSSGSNASCVTPWGDKIVANGDTVPRSPYFTKGVKSIESRIAPIAKCANGSWLLCNWLGNSCTAANYCEVGASGYLTTLSCPTSKAL